MVLRWLSAGCAGLAVWLVAAQFLPHPADVGEEVVVAARDVPLGATLSAADVVLERWPSAQVPVGAVRRLDESVGRVTSGPVLGGELVTVARFRGPPQLRGLPAGQVAVSVPVLEANLLGALRPSDVVMVLVPGSGLAVADRATVLATGADNGAGVLESAAVESPSVLVALTPDEAKAVATTLGSAGGVTGFLVALRP